MTPIDVVGTADFLAKILQSGAEKGFDRHDFALARSLPDLMQADLFGCYILGPGMKPRATLMSHPSQAFLRQYELLRHRDPILLHLLQGRCQAMEGEALLGAKAWSRHALSAFLGHWRLHHSLQGSVVRNGQLIATINFARDRRKGPFTPTQISALGSICANVSALLSPPPESSTTGAASGPQEACDAVVLSDSAGNTLSEDWRGNPPVDIGAFIVRNLDVLRVTQAAHTVCSVLLEAWPEARLTTVRIPGTQQYLSTLTRSTAIPDNASLAQLGERGRMVLNRVVRGYSTKLIAHELLISENTVKDHIRRLFDHFGVHSKAELTWLLNGKVH